MAVNSNRRASLGRGFRAVGERDFDSCAMDARNRVSRKELRDHCDTSNHLARASYLFISLWILVILCGLGLGLCRLGFMDPGRHPHQRIIGSLSTRYSRYAKSPVLLRCP